MRSNHSAADIAICRLRNAGFNVDDTIVAGEHVHITLKRECFAMYPGIHEFQPIADVQSPQYMVRRLHRPYDRITSTDVDLCTQETVLEAKKYGVGITTLVQEQVPLRYGSDTRWRALPPSKRWKNKGWQYCHPSLKKNYLPMSKMKDFIQPWARHPDWFSVFPVGDVYIKQEWIIYAEPAAHSIVEKKMKRPVDEWVQRVSWSVMKVEREES